MQKERDQHAADLIKGGARLEVTPGQVAEAKYDMDIELSERKAGLNEELIREDAQVEFEKKEVTKEELAKFNEAWSTLTVEEQKYLGGFYYTTDIERQDEELEQSAQKKLSKFGFSVDGSISDYLEAGLDVNNWTDAEWAEFKNRK